METSLVTMADRVTDSGDVEMAERYTRKPVTVSFPFEGDHHAEDHLDSEDEVPHSAAARRIEDDLGRASTFRQHRRKLYISLCRVRENAYVICTMWSHA